MATTNSPAPMTRAKQEEFLRTAGFTCSEITFLMSDEVRELDENGLAWLLSILDPRPGAKPEIPPALRALHQMMVRNPTAVGRCLANWLGQVIGQ